MERRSMFKRLFGKEKEDNVQVFTQLKLMDNSPASFTPYNGDFHLDPDVLACIDAIARNGAKMNPRHIRNYKDEKGNEKLERLKGRTYKILST